MSNEHTPTPWMVSKEQDNQYVIRHPVEKWDLASCWYPRAAIRKGDKDSEEFWDSLRDEQDANAAHIVKCVNSHYLLISALTSARNRLADMLMNGGDDGQAWKEARKSMPLIEAALAAAQGDGE